MSDLPVLDELGAEMLAAFRAAERPRQRRRPLRSLALAALLLVALAATAGAATYYVLSASAIAPFKDRDVEPPQQVAPGSSRLLDLRAADPDKAAPPWALRVARSRTGLTCGTVGQVVDGRLGIVGLDGRFRALPEANADSCSLRGGDGVTLLGLRVFEARRQGDVRTVLDGLADGLKSVTVAAGGGAPRPLRADGGAFVHAMRGYPEDIQPVVTLRFDDGHMKRFALASSPNVYPDPLGGEAWKTEVGGFGCPTRAGRPAKRCNPPVCVTFSTARQGRDSAGSPGLCGRESRTRALFYGSRRLSGKRRLMTSPFSGRWNGHAPRTAFWGLASPDDVESLVLTGPGGLRRELRPSPNRAFLAVLDPEVPPKSLRVEVHYRDGRVERTGPDRALVPNPLP